MRLFWMELYKLLLRKAFLAGLFGALAILLLYFCVGIVGEERSTINGKLYTGWEAVRMDRAVTEEFRGTLSDETAGRIIEKYGFPSLVEEGYGGFRDENYCNGFITEYLGNGWFRDWDDYRISTSLKPIAESELGQTAEKKGEGFFFAYARGWAVLLDTLQLGMILGSVLLIVGLSPIYAEEHQTGMAALLFTCRDGREKDIAIKTAAAFTLAALVYGMIVSAAFLAVGLVYGFDGAKCMSGMVTAQHAVNPFYAICPVLSCGDNERYPLDCAAADPDAVWRAGISFGGRYAAVSDRVRYSGGLVQYAFSTGFHRHGDRNRLRGQRILHGQDIRTGKAFSGRAKAARSDRVSSFPYPICAISYSSRQNRSLYRAPRSKAARCPLPGGCPHGCANGFAHPCSRPPGLSCKKTDNRQAVIRYQRGRAGIFAGCRQVMKKKSI